MTIEEEKEIMKAVTEKIHEVGRLLYSYEIHEILMLFIQKGGETEAKNISCGTCKYADYYYQLEPCKTCINNSARDIHYTKWEEAENEND